MLFIHYYHNTLRHNLGSLPFLFCFFVVVCLFVFLVGSVLLVYLIFVCRVGFLLCFWHFSFLVLILFVFVFYIAPCIASVSGLSIFHCTFGFIYCLWCFIIIFKIDIANGSSVFSQGGIYIYIYIYGFYLL